MPRVARAALRSTLTALGAAVASLIVAPPSADAGQTTVFVNYAGFNYCDVCGVADYATPGNGMEDRAFFDPLPPGAVPTQIVANVQGTCDDSVGVTVDGAFVGVSSFSGTGCACGSCFDGSVASSAVYADGVPGWVYGGNQNLHVDASAIALDGVDVTIVYRICGDGVADAGEVCDAAGDATTCDGDCTAVVCGDGRANAAAGEACDTAGESAGCDDDCSEVVCGDGHVNGAAGEICDVGGENAACDDDCTLAECGDGHPNAATGEGCDDGNVRDGDGCSASCQVEASTTGAGAGGGATGPAGVGGGGDVGGGPGASGAGGDGGDATTGPTGPTASGIAVVTAAGAGGSDPSGAGARDPGAGGEGGASADPDAAGSSSEGCGCDVAGAPSTPARALVALGVVVAAAVTRKRRRSARAC